LILRILPLKKKKHNNDLSLFSSSQVFQLMIFAQFLDIQIMVVYIIMIYM